MSLVDVLSLIRLGRVCKRFYHLHQDKSNWLAVDLTTLTPYLNVLRLKKVIQQLLPSDLCALQLRSNAVACMTDKSHRPILNFEALTNLLTKCAHIKSIFLEECDLRVGREHLFLRYKSFQSVSIVNCHTEVGWLEGVCWPNLRYLSLQDTKKTTDREMKAIAGSSWSKELVSLNVIGNYRLTNAGIVHLCKPDGTKLLKRLSMSLSKSLNCEAFNNLVALPSLKELCLAGRPIEDGHGIENIPLLLPHLKLLDICSLEISAGKKLQLEQQLPETKVMK